MQAKQQSSVIELGVVAFIGWVVSNWVRDSLSTTTFDSNIKVGAQILAFFALLLIYYKLLRVHVHKEL